MSLRDTTPLIIHIDGDTIRAGRGLAELYELPSVTFKARYGLRPLPSLPPTDPSSSSSSSPTPTSQRPLSDYLIGQSLDDVLAKEGGGAVDVAWPFENVREEDGRATGNGNADGGKGKRREVDWRGREAILYHIFYTSFALQPTTNLTTLLLIPPASDVLSPSTLSTYTQLAFETLNVPAFHILPPALASLYGTNSTTGLAVMVGKSETVIDVVWEGSIKEESRVILDVGKSDCLTHLSDLLSRDQPIQDQISRFGLEHFGSLTWSTSEIDIARKAYEELAQAILDHEKLREGKVVDVPLKGGGVAAVATTDEEEEDGVFNVAKVLIKDDASKSIQQLKDSKSKKSAAQHAADLARTEANLHAAAATARAEAALDIYAFEVPILGGRKVRVGPVRHRACEPLYREGNVGKKGKVGRTVQEGLAVAIGRLDREFRQPVWDSVVFSGALTKIPSLQFAIASYLTPYLVTSPDRETDYQHSRILLKKMPDYYVNFRSNATDLAPFLGGSITAKIVFTDGRDQNCITKHIYNQYGPGASHLAIAME